MSHYEKYHVHHHHAHVSHSGEPTLKTVNHDREAIYATGLSFNLKVIQHGNL